MIYRGTFKSGPNGAEFLQVEIRISAEDIDTAEQYLEGWGAVHLPGMELDEIC